MLQTDLSLKYLYRPNQIDVENPKLLLLLHGYGSNEADLFSFVEELPKEFFIVSVRAPKPLDFGGYAWYDIDFVNLKKLYNVEQAQESIELIRKFIPECVEKFNLDTENVWMCGFSQGAILSCALTLQNQQNIKRVICLSGYPAQDIIGKDIQQEYSDLKFFISHGTEDAVIPVDWARKSQELLSGLNIPHQYKEYRSGHGIVPQNFYDMLDWINNEK